MSAFQSVLRRLLAGVILFAASSALPAQTTQSSNENPAPEQSYNPIPQRLIWPGIAVIVLIGIFVTAALAGPLIRANQDDSESSDSSDPPS